jgi:hypothetical protein
MRVVMDADERRIDRSAGHHRVAGLAERPCGVGERGDEAAEVDDVLQRHGLAVALAQVGDDRLVQAGVRLGVAEDAVVHALVQRVEDHRGGGEVHVGDPERIELRPAVVFDAAGPAAVDQGVEVEMHARELWRRGGKVSSAGFRRNLIGRARDKVSGFAAGRNRLHAVRAVSPRTMGHQ